MPIGTNPLGQWLSYYLWTGDVLLEQYAEAVIKYLCPCDWEPFVNVTISWDKRKPKVSITSVVPMFADCRSKRWRQQRQALQSWLDAIVDASSQIEKMIEQSAFLLGEHYRHSKEVQELRERACEARRHPDKTWEQPEVVEGQIQLLTYRFVSNASEILDELAHEEQCRADRAMQYYLELIDESLEKFAPPKQRQQFRHQVFSKVEKLAQDQRWLDEYEAKLESA